MARQGLPEESARILVVGRRTPPERLLYGGVMWGTAVKVIVRERRSVTRLGVAVALVLVVGQWLLSALIGRCCWVCRRRGCLCVCPWLPARVGVR